jgi:hypothetical protein
VHVFDASAYIDQDVDVLQFLPDAASNSFRPVPLFTLTGCSSQLVQTAGHIRNGVTAQGRLFVQRMRAIFTGKARAVQAGKGEPAISSGAPRDPREKEVRRHMSCHAFTESLETAVGAGSAQAESFAPAKRRDSRPFDPSNGISKRWDLLHSMAPAPSLQLYMFAFTSRFARGWAARGWKVLANDVFQITRGAGSCVEK